MKRKCRAVIVLAAFFFLRETMQVHLHTAHSPTAATEASEEVSAGSQLRHSRDWSLVISSPQLDHITTGQFIVIAAAMNRGAAELLVLCCSGSCPCHATG